jgi:hypothetical protein
MRDFWGLVGSVLALIFAGIFAGLMLLWAFVMIMIWPTLAGLLVYIAGRVAGVW